MACYRCLSLALSLVGMTLFVAAGCGGGTAVDIPPPKPLLTELPQIDLSAFADKLTDVRAELRPDSANSIWIHAKATVDFGVAPLTGLVADFFDGNGSPCGRASAMLVAKVMIERPPRKPGEPLPEPIETAPMPAGSEVVIVIRVAEATPTATPAKIVVTPRQ